MLPKEKLGLIVSQFYCGEHDGAALIHELAPFAPGTHEKQFCSFWEADEQKHDRLFGSIAHLYPAVSSEKKFNSLIGGIFSIAWDCVHEKDWVKCMTIAAVIEHIALAGGEYLLKHGDQQVQQIVLQILPDERKHLAFSEQQLRELLRVRKNKKKVEQVLFRLKRLSFSLGKKGLFQSYDISISNIAQHRFLTQLDQEGLWYPNIVNGNGFLRNTFLEAGLLLIS